MTEKECKTIIDLINKAVNDIKFTPIGEYGQVICIDWLQEIALKVVELRNDETFTTEQKQAWLKRVEEYKKLYKEKGKQMKPKKSILNTIKTFIGNIKWRLQYNKKYKKRKFKIKAEIDERWVDDFCTFLYELEHNGNIGHSSLIGFYADGDGDFRAKFKIKTSHNFTKPRNKTNKECEKIYDAG